MSGRTKKILYRVFDFLLYAAAAAVMVVMLFNISKDGLELAEILITIGVMLAVIFHVPVLIHELGHLFFGWLGGMKLVSFKVSLFSAKTAGATEMFPKNGKRVRAKFILFALGGSVLNLLVGGVLISLYFTLDYHLALLFFGMLAPFVIYEGIRAMIPMELSAGKTDGGVILGLMKKAPDEEVMLRVLTAQGILYRGKFSDVPKELLFDVPVVREDLSAYHALLFLQMQFQLFLGEDAEARGILARLRSLEEFFSESQLVEVFRYEKYFTGKFQTKKQLLLGVDDLERKLEESVSN